MFLACDIVFRKYYPTSHLLIVSLEILGNRPILNMHQPLSLYVPVQGNALYYSKYWKTRRRNEIMSLNLQKCLHILPKPDWL